jgi:hypothetical protein
MKKRMLNVRGGGSRKECNLRTYTNNAKTCWVRFLGCAAFLLLLAGTVVRSDAQTFFLNDGNSTVQVKADSTAGMTSYLVDGVNQVKDQWFYYRIGNSGPESPIETIGSLVWSQSEARSLDLTYGNSLYSARVVYTLTGGTPGTGSSSLNEAITFLNKSTTSALSLRFFDYSDFDLTGVSGGQSLQFGTSVAPPPTWVKTNTFTQTKGVNSLTTTVASGINFPSHVEADLYSQTLTSLTDPNPTTLSDAMGPVYGDVTGAFEWDVTLGAGASLTISKLISMQIPEPSALGLLALGLAATLCRRRRTR